MSERKCCKSNSMREFESDALYAGNIQELYWQELIFIPADIIRGNRKYYTHEKIGFRCFMATLSLTEALSENLMLLSY